MQVTAVETLIRDIEAAFGSDERGAGLTLHEAAAFEGNDYCVAEERARVRALAPRNTLAGHPAHLLGGV